MTKGVKIGIAVAIVLFITAVFAAIKMYHPSDTEKVLITRDNEVLYEIDLSKNNDETIKIEYTGGGYNLIEISDGKIRISDADCPDKTCVKTGRLQYADVPIICLPHHLVIRFSDEV